MELTKEQNNLIEQAMQSVELIEIIVLRLAAEEYFDNIRPDLYDLLKSLHKTKHVLEDLPQTSQ